MRRLGTVRTILGEGPYWDVQEQVLWFIDMRSKIVWRFDPANELFRSWPAPLEPSAITRTQDGRLVAVLADGLYDFDPSAGTFIPLLKPYRGPSDVQPNDAKVDRQGRFIIGEKNATRAGREPICAIRSYDGRHEQVLDTGYIISNGPCWSPDGCTFYIADSIPNKIFAYDYDTAHGTVSNRREFADGSLIGGFADGATVDADGRLWMAFCGEGKIACYNPDGSMHRIIATDVQWVASLQFGGPELDKLYVISFDPEKASGRPPDDNSGYLYVIDDIGARGLPEPLARV